MAKTIASLKATILVQLGESEPITVGHAILPVNGEIRHEPDWGLDVTDIDTATFTAATDDFTAKLKAFLETL